MGLSPAEREAFHAAVAGVQRNVEAELASGHRGDFPLHFIARLHEALDRVVVRAADKGADIACRAGCSHCCHARVEASAAEILRIAAELKARTAAELATWVARLEAHPSAPATESWAERPACPFLIDAHCMIYAVRPSTCRKTHSLDQACCAAHAVEIPQDLALVMQSEALIKGTNNAYAEQGYDSVGHELVSALRQTLADGETATRWGAGGVPFALTE